MSMALSPVPPFSPSLPLREPKNTLKLKDDLKCRLPNPGVVTYILQTLGGLPPWGYSPTGDEDWPVECSDFNNLIRATHLWMQLLNGRISLRSAAKRLGPKRLGFTTVCFITVGLQNVWVSQRILLRNGREKACNLYSSKRSGFTT